MAYIYGCSSQLKKYGLKIKIHKSVTTRVGLLFLSSENTTVANITLEEGLNTIPSTSIPEEYANVCFDLNSLSIGDYIEVEQLPLYPGALVSDGVDDYAISDEVIDEEIGGMVYYGEEITAKNGAYFFNCGIGPENNNRIYFYRSNEGQLNIGRPGIVTELPTASLTRNPLVPADKLYISVYTLNNNYANMALYQLRLIKTQPTDVQLEVIKQQVLREHNDYIKEMG